MIMYIFTISFVNNVSRVCPDGIYGVTCTLTIHGLHDSCIIVHTIYVRTC